MRRLSLTLLLVVVCCFPTKGWAARFVQPVCKFTSATTNPTLGCQVGHDKREAAGGGGSTDNTLVGYGGPPAAGNQLIVLVVTDHGITGGGDGCGGNCNDIASISDAASDTFVRAFHDEYSSDVQAEMWFVKSVASTLATDSTITITLNSNVTFKSAIVGEFESIGDIDTTHASLSGQSLDGKSGASAFAAGDVIIGVVADVKINTIKFEGCIGDGSITYPCSLTGNNSDGAIWQAAGNADGTTPRTLFAFATISPTAPFSFNSPTSPYTVGRDGSLDMNGNGTAGKWVALAQPFKLQTNTPTQTPTLTPIASQTPTKTFTFTPTVTGVPTLTPTFTRTPTITQTPTPTGVTLSTPQTCNKVTLWTNVHNASTSSNTITKTSGGGSWDAGGMSAKPIGSGAGFAQATAHQGFVFQDWGLTTVDPFPAINQYLTIRFAWRLSGLGFAQVAESNVVKATLASYAANDSFRVDIGGDSLVRYYWQPHGQFGWELIYTNPTPLISTDYPLSFVAGMSTGGVPVDNAYIETPACDGIGITSPVIYETWQRTITTPPSSGTCDIPVSGSFVGAPDAIDWSLPWVGGGTFTGHTLDGSPNIGAGTYSGTIAGVPGGQGTLTVRFHTATGTSATKQFIGCGDGMWVIGQSNAAGAFQFAQPYSSLNGFKAVMKRKNSWQEMVDPTAEQNTTGGSLWPRVATAWMNDQAVPVFLENNGIGSSWISLWTPDTVGSIYDDSLNNGPRQMHGFRAAIFWQGESDTGPHGGNPTTSQADYKAALELVAAHVLRDTGIKMTTTTLNKIGTATAGGIDGIRLANQQAWTEALNVLPGPALYDIGLCDPVQVHLESDGEAQIAAPRFWASIRKNYLNGADGRGPYLTDAHLKGDGATIELTFADDTPPLLPVSGLTLGAWSIKDNGSLVSIASITRPTNTTLHIATDPLTGGPYTVTYASGNTGNGPPAGCPNDNTITITDLTDSNTITHMPADIIVDYPLTIDPIASPTPTVTQTPTNLPTTTGTPPATATFTITPTITPTRTATNTRTFTPTPTVTSTRTPSPINLPSPWPTMKGTIPQERREAQQHALVTDGNKVLDTDNIGFGYKNVPEGHIVIEGAMIDGRNQRTTYLDLTDFLNVATPTMPPPTDLPTETPTTTDTPTFTPTPFPTFTAIPCDVQCATHTPTVTPTITNTPTHTRTFTPTPTCIITNVNGQAQVLGCSLVVPVDAGPTGGIIFNDFGGIQDATIGESTTGAPTSDFAFLREPRIGPWCIDTNTGSAHIICFVATPTPTITQTPTNTVPSATPTATPTVTATACVEGDYVCLGGRATPQVINGGTASGDNLTLSSTSHATKGKVLINSDGRITFDELAPCISVNETCSTLGRLTITAPDASANNIVFRSYGAGIQTNLNLGRTLGTKANPTPISSGATVDTVNLQAHDGSAWATGARIASIATETWSGSAHGMRLAFSGIAATATLLTDWLTLRDGHLVSLGTAPTLSACGTSPTTVTGNDIAGHFTVGTVATTCTLTFAKAYTTNAPECFATDETSVLAVDATPSTTTIVFTTATASAISSQKIHYGCIGVE